MQVSKAEVWPDHKRVKPVLAHVVPNSLKLGIFSDAAKIKKTLQSP